MHTAQRRVDHSPGPRQFVNDLLGVGAFERGEAAAHHRPLEVHLQLASGCNLDCYMCSEHLRPEAARHGRGLQFLDPALVEIVAREILPYSSRLHLGVGGEPMLAPRFLEYVERAHALNQQIHLTTNGTRIATNRVAEVLARCCDSIELSVDGASAATYERIRGGATFARLKQNVELLNTQRLARAENERPRLTLCMVLMKSNAHELVRFVELAAEWRADGVAAWPVIPVTPEGGADLFDAGAARDVLHEARERAVALGLSLDLPYETGAAGELDPANGRAQARRHLRDLERAQAEAAPTEAAPAAGRLYCHMPTVALYVAWDGRVYPCANPDVQAGEALGVLGRESFAEIWNGREFRNLRAGLARGEAPEVCRRCPIVRGVPVAGGFAPRSGASSDLVSHFAGLDLAPAAPPGEARDAIEAALDSGLARRVQALLEESRSDNRQLRERVALLESECAQLAAHCAALQSERDQLVLHAGTLDAERIELRKHSATLGRERPQLLAHAATLGRERPQLLAHVATLEAERVQLVRHAAVLEREREQLVGHVGNLERILGRVRGLRIYRTLSSLKDLFIAPRPRAPRPYVPPWVADGSRPAGQSLDRLLLDPARQADPGRAHDDPVDSGATQP